MSRVAARLTVMVLVIGATALVFAEEGQQGTDEQRLMQLERDWAQSVVKNDVTFLERIAHADYTSVSPIGQLVSRDQEIADAKTGAFKADSIVVEDLKARIYGGDTAVVTGRSTIKATFKGQDVSGQYRFTDTFIKANREWRCVATQATRIVDQP